MTTPHRTLPPLPVPAITMKHGPWKPSQFDDYETYCAHCLTRSIFAHSRRCDPRIDPESLRARDLEVARVVLEGAKNALVQASIEAKRGTDRAVLTAAAIIVRALEVRHHE
jgi:hypothetical protein